MANETKNPLYPGPSRKPNAPKPPLPLPNQRPEYGAEQAAEINRQVRQGIEKSRIPGTEPTIWETMQERNKNR